MDGSKHQPRSKKRRGVKGRKRRAVVADSTGRGRRREETPIGGLQTPKVAIIAERRAGGTSPPPPPPPPLLPPFIFTNGSNNTLCVCVCACVMCGWGGRVGGKEKESDSKQKIQRDR